MKHIVMLAGIVYPRPSATGRCALEYLSLLQEDARADVVYIRSDAADTASHTENNLTYYPCADWRLAYELRCAAGKGLINRLGIALAKGIGRLQTRLLFPNNLRWFALKAYRQLEAIHQKQPIEVLFSVSSPFAAQLAAARFKAVHPEVRWVSYTADPYSSARSLRPLLCSHKRAVEAERSYLQKADVCFTSPELLTGRRDLTEGLACAELPYMLSFPPAIQSSTVLFDDDYVNLVYAGSFYRDLRSPTQLLETIYALREKKLRLYIYSAGECLQELLDYAQREDSNIFLHKPVNRETLAEIYEQADILVNVANKSTEFSPSKVFEYLATGKPIIEFTAYTENRLLKAYPLALSLLAAQENTAAEVWAFCEKHAHDRLSEQDIAALYPAHMPQAVKRLLYKACFGEDT